MHLIWLQRFVESKLFWRQYTHLLLIRKFFLKGRNRCILFVAYQCFITDFFFELRRLLFKLRGFFFYFWCLRLVSGSFLLVFWISSWILYCRRRWWNSRICFFILDMDGVFHFSCDISDCRHYKLSLCFSRALEIILSLSYWCDNFCSDLTFIHSNRDLRALFHS